MDPRAYLLLFSSQVFFLPPPLFLFFFRVFEVKFKGGEEKAYIYILKEICNGSIRLSRYFQRNLHLLIYDELWWYRGKKRTHRRKFHLNSTIEKRKKSDELNFFRVKRVSLYSRCAMHGDRIIRF